LRQESEEVPERFTLAAKAAYYVSTPADEFDMDVVSATVAACSLVSRDPDAGLGGRERERAVQCQTVREVLGNPFRAVALAPSWLTSDVVALATGIYEERAFDRMPILADALQDAGCESEEVLNHCRGQNEHWKGCWVADLLLGKS
jgi:hypothetical protein